MEEYAHLPYVENLGEYKPGGFHPVHLGDKLKAGRYRVINKIGHGSFSTVWLAEDEDVAPNRYVALSVHRAGESQSQDNEERLQATNHIKILRHLSESDLSHSGRANVLLPLDTFDLSGPNGQHFCMVTSVQGQSLSMVFKRKSGLGSEVLPLEKAKRAVLDTVRAFAFVHEHGIIHGDLHPGNLLLSLSGSENWTVQEMEAVYESSKTSPVVRNDGKPLPDNVPRYGVEEALGRLSNVSLYTGAIKLADFGFAFFEGNPPNEIDFLGPYIVPEQYCPGHIGRPCDIWTLGCAIYLLLSGRDLFGIPDDSTGVVFSNITAMLGEPPDYILESWRRITIPDLEVRSTPVKELPVWIQEIRSGNDSLRMKNRQDEFSDRDISVLANLLSIMLRYEPSERPTIQAVLQHPAMSFFEGNN
ncbi:putative srpk [Cadophora sp. DSE1049]|nr:putative srpk [Cadophora sp. DSE1049]